MQNRIISNQRGKIKFDTGGSIMLPITNIKTIGRYTCPLRIAEVEDYTFEDGTLTVNKPGRYLIEYN